MIIVENEQQINNSLENGFDSLHEINLSLEYILEHKLEDKYLEKLQKAFYEKMKEEGFSESLLTERVLNSLENEAGSLEMADEYNLSKVIKDQFNLIVNESRRRSLGLKPRLM